MWLIPNDERLLVTVNSFLLLVLAQEVFCHFPVTNDSALPFVEIGVFTCPFLVFIGKGPLVFVGRSPLGPIEGDVG